MIANLESLADFAVEDTGRIIELTSRPTEVIPWARPMRRVLAAHNAIWSACSTFMDQAYEWAKTHECNSRVLDALDALAGIADRLRVGELRPYLYRAVDPAQPAFHRIVAVAGPHEVTMVPFEADLGAWLALAKELLAHAATGARKGNRP